MAAELATVTLVSLSEVATVSEVFTSTRADSYEVPISIMETTIYVHKQIQR